MKKVLVVLLIAVLAMSAVFADVNSFSGSLTTKLNYDFDNNKLALTQSASVTGKFAFGLFTGTSATASAKGEGYPYAELEGALSLDFDDFVIDFVDRPSGEEYTRWKVLSAFWKAQHTGEEDFLATSYENTYFKTYDLREFRFSWSADSFDEVFTRAAIVGENWELDLLHNYGVGNFAHSSVVDTHTYQPTKKVYTSVAYDFDNSTSDDYGVTFKYEDFSVSVNRFSFAKGSEDFQLSFGATDYALTDKVTASVGTSFVDDDAAYKLNASGIVSYATEEVVANAATDIAFGLSGASTNFDVALDANYLDGAVESAFYYASEATAKNPYAVYSSGSIVSGNWTKLNKAVYDLSLEYSVDDDDVDTSTYSLEFKNANDKSYISAFELTEATVEKLMSAKVAVDVAKLATLGDVSTLSVTLDAHDVLDNNDLKAYNAEVVGALEKYGVSAKAGAKEFTSADNRRIYAEVVDDFTKITELPVKSLVLTVGSEDLSMKIHDSNYDDNLYVKLVSQINDAVKVTLKGNELAGEDKDVVIGAAVDYTGVENLTVGASVSRAFNTTAKKTSLEASATYDGEVFDVTGLVQAKLYADGTDATVGAYVKATTDQVVHGATLALQYGGLDSTGAVTANWVNGTALKSLTASCKIAF